MHSPPGRKSRGKCHTSPLCPHDQPGSARPVSVVTIDMATHGRDLGWGPREDQVMSHWS